MGTCISWPSDDKYQKQNGSHSMKKSTIRLRDCFKNLTHTFTTPDGSVIFISCAGPNQQLVKSVQRPDNDNKTLQHR